eukprot:6202209-Alexandrium_andersonii.AAC.1
MTRAEAGEGATTARDTIAETGRHLDTQTRTGADAMEMVRLKDPRVDLVAPAAEEAAEMTPTTAVWGTIAARRVHLLRTGV